MSPICPEAGYVGERYLDDVTVAAVEAFSAALSQREHNGKRMAPRTRNKVLNVLHGIVARARKDPRGHR
jgi:hypothetical protein